jgi:anti-sigma B factor antagonist
MNYSLQIFCFSIFSNTKLNIYLSVLKNIFYKSKKKFNLLFYNLLLEENMFISDFKKQGVKILELNGKIDASATNFEEDLKELVTGENKIIVDCSNLNFINSAGLRTFLSILKGVTAINGRIIISSLQENVKEIFSISGFINLFEIAENKEEAIDKILL